MDGWAAWRRLLALLGALGVAAFGCLAAASGAVAAADCDRVAAPDGSDSAPGTIEQPVRTAQKLVNGLAAGQTGCLRAGTYAGDTQIKVSTPSVTVTSYPGERATVVGRLWVAKEAPGTTIANLDLNGANDRALPSPTINADDVSLVDNDITNRHTAICVSVGSLDSYGRAHRLLIAHNRIHDCGRLPAKNFDHGVYVAAADDTVIRDNWIYDNADRGIQLYPDSSGTLVTGNVIDGNGEGLIFGGDGAHASSDNVVEHNVITNSKIRDNIESSWGGAIGTGNIVRDNCVGGGAYDEGDGGILQGTLAKRGFSTQDNLVGVPEYADYAGKDFSIDPASACGKRLGLTPPPDTTTPPPDTTTPPPDTTTPPPDTTTPPPETTTPPPETTTPPPETTTPPPETTTPPPETTTPPPETTTPPPETTTPPPEVTLETRRKNVKVGKPLRVRGTAPGAGRVQIQVHRDGGWHGIGVSGSASDGSYSTRIAIRRSGRGRIKAVAVGLQDSHPVEVKVKPKHRRR